MNYKVVANLGTGPAMVAVGAAVEGRQAGNTSCSLKLGDPTAWQERIISPVFTALEDLVTSQCLCLTKILPGF